MRDMCCTCWSWATGRSMRVVTVSLSLVCRKLCAGVCEVRNRAMRGGACCKIVLSLFRKRRKAGFAPDAMERVGSMVENQR